MLRLWYGVLVVAFYLEPPVIAYLGDACPDRVSVIDDRLWQLLAPFHEALALHPALFSLLLCAYYGLFLIHAFVAVHRKVYHDEGRLLLTELALLLTTSLLLHAASCSHRDAGTIYSTGQLAAETVLSPTHAVSNAWFAPRLAWALLLLQERNLGPISLALVLLLVLLCGALLHQLDVRTFALSCAVAWALVPPRTAPDAYKPLQPPGSPRDTPLFTIGETKGSTSVSSNSSSGGSAEATAAAHPRPHTHGFLDGEDEDYDAAYDNDADDMEHGRHLPQLNEEEDEHGLREIDLRPSGTPRPHQSLQPVTPRTPKAPAAAASSAAVSAAAGKAAVAPATQKIQPLPLPPQSAPASRSALGAAAAPAAPGAPPPPPQQNSPLPHSELP
jgi:hypothetical protein